MPFGPFPNPRPVGPVTSRRAPLRYVGLDLHKRTVEVCILSRAGRLVARHSLDCERAALERFAREHLRPTDRLAVEATTNTWAVADILRPFVAAVVVGNPLQIKAIAQANVTTDKIDAEVLANLLRCDFLPDVWEPDAATQRLRHLTGVRSALVADRTRLKNRIHSVLAGLLVTLPEGASSPPKVWPGSGPWRCQPTLGGRWTGSSACMTRWTPNSRRSTCNCGHSPTTTTACGCS